MLIFIAVFKSLLNHLTIIALNLTINHPICRPGHCLAMSYKPVITKALCENLVKFAIVFSQVTLQCSLIRH